MAIFDLADLICRNYRASDLDEVARIWLAAWHSTGIAETDEPSENDLRQRIDVELAAGWLLLIASHDNRALGFMAIKRERAILDQLFVDPAAQGRGVGLRLLEEAKARMPAGFHLRVAAENHGAQAFYQRAGLEEAGLGCHERTGRSVRFYRWRGT